MRLWGVQTNGDGFVCWYVGMLARRGRWRGDFARVESNGGVFVCWYVGPAARPETNRTYCYCWLVGTYHSLFLDYKKKRYVRRYQHTNIRNEPR